MHVEPPAVATDVRILKSSAAISSRPSSNVIPRNPIKRDRTIIGSSIAARFCSIQCRSSSVKSILSVAIHSLQMSECDVVSNSRIIAPSGFNGTRSPLVAQKDRPSPFLSTGITDAIPIPCFKFSSSTDHNVSRSGMAAVLARKSLNIRRSLVRSGYNRCSICVRTYR